MTDRELAKFEGRIETDRHGHILMSPPPAPHHGAMQSKISYLLWNGLSTGRVITECTVSTSDGVKAADVAWASPASIRELGGSSCFLRAPEICVEVVSPGNSESEMEEKRDLYFDAGAHEVWICAESGEMTFFIRGSAGPQPLSQLCPAFPRRIELT